MSNCEYKICYDNFKNELQSELGVHVNAVPKITSIVVSTTNKNACSDKKVVTLMVELLRLVTGQEPVVTKIKKSVAGFKIREGWPIGAKVTLRSDKMYDFLERLVKIVFPRVRDFRGLSAKSVNVGVHNLGFKDFNIFPEVELLRNDVSPIGLNISIVTTATKSEHTLALLDKFNFPIRK